MRVDDQLIEMDQAVQKKILLETEPDWSMYVIPDASIEDLSMGAIEKARTLYKMKNKKIESEVDTWDDITFLNKAKLTIK
jgi:ATP-dependent DNA helicase RecG